MTEDAPIDLDHTLFARWRSASAGPAERPDGLMLAAYIDRRLPEDEVAHIETALAHDADLLDDYLATRGAVGSDTVGSIFLIRAQALVSERPAGAGAEIVSLRRGRIGGLRGAITWGGLAASILLVSLVGFNLGVEAQQSFEQQNGTAPVDLLQPAESTIG